MARYLLVEFDNDDQADTLRAQIDSAAKKGKPYRVLGMFQKPRRFCACPPDKDRQNWKRLVRGSKYGWWVCGTCKRARLGIHQLNNLLSHEERLSPTTSDGVDYLEPGTPQVRTWAFKPDTLSISLYPKKP